MFYWWIYEYTVADEVNNILLITAVLISITYIYIYAICIILKQGYCILSGFCFISVRK